MSSRLATTAAQPWCCRCWSWTNRSQTRYSSRPTSLNCCIQTQRHAHTDRQTDRQTDRHRDMLTDRQTQHDHTHRRDIHHDQRHWIATKTDRQACSQTDRQTDRQTDTRSQHDHTHRQSIHHDTELLWCQTDRQTQSHSMATFTDAVKDWLRSQTDRHITTLSPWPRPQMISLSCYRHALRHVSLNIWQNGYVGNSLGQAVGQ